MDSRACAYRISRALNFGRSSLQDNFATGDLAFPGVIENTFMSDLTIINCLFENNSFGPDGMNPAVSCRGMVDVVGGMSFFE